MSSQTQTGHVPIVPSCLKNISSGFIISLSLSVNAKFMCQLDWARLLTKCYCWCLCKSVSG